MEEKIVPCELCKRANGRHTMVCPTLIDPNTLSTTERIMWSKGWERAEKGLPQPKINGFSNHLKFAQWAWKVRNMQKRQEEQKKAGEG